MRALFKFIIPFFIFLGFQTFACAIVLNTEKTAVVDVEKIFNEYRKTKDARLDIENKKIQIKKSFEFKQKELKDLESKYAVLSSAKSSDSTPKDGNEVTKSTDTISSSFINQTPFSTSTMTVKSTMFDLNSSTNTPKNLRTPEEIKKEMEEKIEILKAELVDYEIKKTEAIDNLEKDYLYNITGEVYEKIAFIAKKYGYNVIFDKKDLVYSWKNYDLTDLVLQEINKI